MGMQSLSQERHLLPEPPGIIQLLDRRILGGHFFVWTAERVAARTVRLLARKRRNVRTALGTRLPWAKCSLSRLRNSIASLTMVAWGDIGAILNTHDLGIPFARESKVVKYPGTPISVVEENLQDLTSPRMRTSLVQKPLVTRDKREVERYFQVR
jgi:hypothetical protein